MRHDAAAKAANYHAAKERVRQFVSKNPGQTSGQIADALNLPRVQVSNALYDLKATGFHCEFKGRFSRWSAQRVDVVRNGAYVEWGLGLTSS